MDEKYIYSTGLSQDGSVTQFSQGLKHLQRYDIIEAGPPIPGFSGFEVTATSEKKSKNQGTAKANQDNIMIQPWSDIPGQERVYLGLIGVFDGLGGTANGNKASHVAEMAISSEFPRALVDVQNLPLEEIKSFIMYSQIMKLNQIGAADIASRVENRMERMLEAAATVDHELLRRAHALIMSMVKANTEVEKTGGHTTACVASLYKSDNGNTYAIIANIGDSGAFIKRQDGTIKQVVMEDSYISKMLHTGQLTRDKLAEMKKNPFAEHPDVAVGDRGSYADLKSLMTASMGGQHNDTVVYPSLEIVRLEPGDELFLATDGILDQYEKDEKLDVAALEFTLSDAIFPGENPLNVLRNEAYQRGITLGPLLSTDDMTAIRAVAL